MMQNKGYEYEKFVRLHMMNCLNQPIYLWKDAPTPLLISLGIIDSHNAHRLKRKEQKENPLIDTGIDIVADQLIVQCKNGYKNGLTFSDLTGFSIWALSLKDRNIIPQVYYTSKLSRNLEETPVRKVIEFIRLKMPDEKKNIIEEKKITPHDYQIDAKKAFDEHFKKNNNEV